MRIHHAILAAVLVAPAAAQMSGSYTIDPNGSGTRNFTGLNAASVALLRQGVSGPVTITVARGTFQGTWYLPPVAGASSTNTILIKAAEYQRATINPDAKTGRAIEFSFGTPTNPVQWYILESLRISGQIYTSENQTYVSKAHQNIELRYCLVSGRATLMGSRYRVHHNTFRGTAQTEALNIRASDSEVHHNIVQGSGVIASGTYNDFGGRLKIYNNLIYGSTRGGLTMYQVYDSIVAHNTIVNQAPSYATILIGGHGLRPVRLHGNIIVQNGSGSNSAGVIRDSSVLAPGFLSDGNLFQKPNSGGQFVTLPNAVYLSFGNWRFASGQDKNSLEADPKFKNPGGGDYHLPLLSPAKDKAFGTPSFVKTDLEDFARDAKPDHGCYEAFEAFTLFGKGCAGTLFHVPKLGVSGSPALGSKNFAFTLSKGLGGARAFLAIGGSNQSWGSIPLPLRYGGSCNVHVSLDLLNPVQCGGTGAGNGTATVPIQIPNNAALRGRHFFVQWAVVDAAAPLGVSFSEGGDLTFR